MICTHGSISTFFPKEAMVKVVARERLVDLLPRAMAMEDRKCVRADSLTGWASHPYRALCRYLVAVTRWRCGFERGMFRWRWIWSEVSWRRCVRVVPRSVVRAVR